MNSRHSTVCARDHLAQGRPCVCDFGKRAVVIPDPPDWRNIAAVLAFELRAWDEVRAGELTAAPMTREALTDFDNALKAERDDNR